MGRLIGPMLRDPLFLAGAFARALLIALVTPIIHGDWFIPFLASVPTSGDVDIWRAFLGGGGDPMSFPYGVPYILVFGVPVWCAQSFGPQATLLALSATVFVADAALCAILVAWTKNIGAVLRCYWLSPVVLYVCYWHGQLDILPTLLLTGAIWAVVSLRLRLGATLLGWAAAAKLSMLMAAPVICIFLLKNKRRREGAATFMLIALATFSVLMLPILVSGSARQMVIETPEARKIYDFAISVSGVTIYVVPVVYAALAYCVWNIRQISSALFVNIIGLTFLPILLLTPASPGWFLWFIPALAHHQILHGRRAVLLGFGFSLGVVASGLSTASGVVGPGGVSVDADSLFQHVPITRHFAVSLLHTMAWALGILLAVRMVRDGILRNFHFRLGRRRIVIGIAGDSGTGKDTLALALKDILGVRSTLHVSGDDYHMWDRARPMWSVVTHLNPNANRLNDFVRDVLRLARGESVRARHYDHRTGLLSRLHPSASNDVIVVSGLHALHSPSLRTRYDVAVFLDMDEPLRRALKLRRDTNERGKSEAAVLASLSRREADREQFILPQRSHADIIFSLAAASERDLHAIATGAEDFATTISVTLREGLEYDDISRFVLASGTTSIDVEHHSDHPGVTLAFSGAIRGVDSRLVNRCVNPDMAEYLETTEQWHDGWLGLMQFFLLHVLLDRFRRSVAAG